MFEVQVSTRVIVIAAGSAGVVGAAQDKGGHLRRLRPHWHLAQVLRLQAAVLLWPQMSDAHVAVSPQALL